jgi:hypothetical protein
MARRSSAERSENEGIERGFQTREQAGDNFKNTESRWVMDMTSRVKEKAGCTVRANHPKGRLSLFIIKKQGFITL